MGVHLSIFVNFAGIKRLAKLQRWIGAPRTGCSPHYLLRCRIMLFPLFLVALVTCAQFRDVLGDVLQISPRDSLHALSKREGTILQISPRNHLDGLAGRARVRRQGSALQITPRGHLEGLLGRAPVKRRGSIIQISPRSHLGGLAGRALTKRQGTCPAYVSEPPLTKSSLHLPLLQWHLTLH
jgi:hypothetical protein